jgi:release factor glutamine methyltransferase
MAETWTTLKVLEWTAKKFAEKQLPSARLDAEVLLAHTLSTNRVGLYTAFDQPLKPEELTTYRELIRRRLAGEPIAYLVGEQEFWSLPLVVDARVLVPRRDTETLVEAGLRAARGAGVNVRRIVDACTGSGAVALALATELPEARLWATDVSPGALAVARANVTKLKLEERVFVVEGDLLAAPEVAANAPYDLVVSNPPYVPSGDIAGLSAEVRAEPRLALDGGADGLDLVRRLAPAAYALLAPGGTFALEHGFDQGAAVRELLSASGFVDVVSTRDLAEHERVSAGRRPS